MKKRILEGALTVILAVSLVVPLASGASARSRSETDAADVNMYDISKQADALPYKASGDVLFENDFDDPDLQGLSDEALAKAVFGEGNYIFGHAGSDPTLKIENGALRMVGDDNTQPSDGQMKNNRTQFLLANHREIPERGVVIECDYTYNPSSANTAFTFTSKPLVKGTTSGIDSGDLWIAGIWAQKGYRTSLRCQKTNNVWEKPGLVDQKTTTYSLLGTSYRMKLEVSPADGITLSACAMADEEYHVLQKLDMDRIGQAGVSWTECLEDHVRLILQNGCDVTIDNLKVSLMKKETPVSPNGDVIFENDFNASNLANLEGEALAKAVFGEGNYVFGHAGTDPTLKIENGALRMIGDDNTKPSDGRMQNNRTQFLLANHREISERGVVIECDYTYNSSSANTAFTFTSKPLVRGTTSGIDSGDLWIAGIWAQKGYRTSLRCQATGNGWEKPGLVDQQTTTYSLPGTSYRMRIEVSPADGLTLSARTASEESYHVLQKLDMDRIGQAGVSLADCMEDHVRLILQNGCDVTIDNLKVSLLEKTGYHVTDQVRLTVDSSVNVQGAGAGSTADSKTTYTVDPGTRATVRTEKEGFLYWTNENHTIMSRDQEYTFFIVSSTELVAQCTQTSKTYVEFVSDYGQVVGSGYYTKNQAESVTIPKGPSKAGCVFQKWDKTAQEIQDAVKGGVERLTVRPVYTESGDTYDVTVYVNGTKDDGISKKALKGGSTCFVTAPATSGALPFSHWAKDPGGTQVLGYGESYFLQVTSDTELYAIYKDEADLKAPVIRETGRYAFMEDGIAKIGLTFTRDVPEGYELLAHGAVLSTKNTDPTLQGEDVIVMTDHANEASGVYNLTIRVDGHEGEKVYARGYIVVRDSKTGGVIVYYTDVWAGTYESLR